MHSLSDVRSRPVEISWQSVIGSILISTVLSFSYPYVVLKLGLGPGISILAALLGALWFRIFAGHTRGRNYLGINVIQTMATVSAGMAFMCIVYAAFGYLAMNEAVSIHLEITWQFMLIWLSLNGLIGVLVAPLFRQYYMDDPEMIFPTGTASAVTIKVLDSTDPNSQRQFRTLGFGTAAGFIIGLVREKFGWLTSLMVMPKFAIGFEWSALSFGTGMLLSANVGLSMLLGTIVVALFAPAVIHLAETSIISQSVAPQYLHQILAIVANAEAHVTPSPADAAFVAKHGGMAAKAILKGSYYPVSMLWFMWPATIMMIADSLTAVMMRWSKIAAMFRNLSQPSAASEERELGLKTVFGGIIALTVLLAIVQQLFFHLPLWQTVLSVIMSGPLILVGVRVLGLTDQGPVSLMANALQVFFRMLSANIGHNLVAAGMGGSINATAEHMMQCFKTGRLLKATPRTLTLLSLPGAIIGSAAVAFMYPLLVKQYGLGPGGLTAPTGLKLANMAVLLSKGMSAFPPAALEWSIVAGIVGIILAIAKERTKSGWLPNGAGFGFALILPGTLVLPIAAGSIVSWLWRDLWSKNHALHNAVLASGFVAGETFIAGLVLPLLSFFAK